jgi:glycosyltransferase involved in cell wall biosynthesis
LKKCIDSIINQTYRNLEIILVDDGLPDYCGEICDDCKLKDERVVVIHKENGGLSDARNVGLDIMEKFTPEEFGVKIGNWLKLTEKTD